MPTNPYSDRLSKADILQRLTAFFDELPDDARIDVHSFNSLGVMGKTNEDGQLVESYTGETVIRIEVRRDPATMEAGRAVIPS